MSKSKGKSKDDKAATKLTIGDTEITFAPAKKKPSESKKSSSSSQSSGCLLFILFLIIFLMVMALVVAGGTQTKGEANEGIPVSIQLEPGGSAECEPGIRPGGWVKTVAKVRMRSSPGYRNKDDTIHFCKSGDRLSVLSGPAVKDELCWWQVRGKFSGKTVEGWMADHARGGIRLLKPSE